MEVGEERKRGGEAHPAVEIASVPAVADPETDDRDEPQEREQRCCEPDVRARDLVRLEPPGPHEDAKAEPGECKDDGDADGDDDE
jgi:hypothetical protein